jgi:chaperone BCS1
MSSQLNATLPASVPTPFPIIGPALLSSLLSKSAVSEWLKLLLIGGIFQICRRSWSSVYRLFFDYFFITVDIAQTDPCYSEFLHSQAQEPLCST